MLHGPYHINELNTTFRPNSYRRIDIQIKSSEDYANNVCRICINRNHETNVKHSNEYSKNPFNKKAALNFRQNFYVKVKFYPLTFYTLPFYPLPFYSLTFYPCINTTRPNTIRRINGG